MQSRLVILFIQISLDVKFKSVELVE